MADEKKLKVEVEETTSTTGGTQPYLAQQTQTLRENVKTLQNFQKGGRTSVMVVRNLNRLLEGKTQQGLFGLATTLGKLAGPAALLTVAFVGITASIRRGISEIEGAIKGFHGIAQSGFLRRQKDFRKDILNGDITDEQRQQAKQRWQEWKKQDDQMEKQMRRMEAKAASYKAPITAWEGFKQGSIMAIGEHFGWTKTRETEYKEFKEEYAELKRKREELKTLANMDKQIYEKKGKADKVDLIKTTWLDDMSSKGLYMSSQFASVGGGYNELEVMKEQKKLLERIADNTEDDSIAKYSD